MPKNSKEPTKQPKDKKVKEISRLSTKHFISGKKLADAYFAYLSIRKAELMRTEPALTHIDIAKIVSKEWREMPDEEHEKYIMKKSKNEVIQTEHTQDQKVQTCYDNDLTMRSASSNIPQCEFHKDEYKYWCKNCNEWICEFCVTTHSSEGHYCIHLLDFAQRNLLNDVDDLINQTKASGEISKNILNEFDRVIDSFKKIIGQIKRTVLH